MNLSMFRLQPKEGDQAVYLQNSAIEIEFNKEKYIVVPHSAILLLLEMMDFSNNNIRYGK